MKTLTLLRHAKSGWDDPVARDFDRPLNARGLKYFSAAFKDLGLTAAPSEANFVMLVLPSGEQAAQLTQELLMQGIIVRPLASFGLPGCVRISTGTDADNQRAVEAMSGAGIRACVGLR